MSIFDPKTNINMENHLINSIMTPSISNVTSKGF